MDINYNKAQKEVARVLPSWEQVYWCSPAKQRKTTTKYRSRINGYMYIGAGIQVQAEQSIYEYFILLDLMKNTSWNFFIWNQLSSEFSHGD